MYFDCSPDVQHPPTQDAPDAVPSSASDELEMLIGPARVVEVREALDLTALLPADEMVPPRLLLKFAGDDFPDFPAAFIQQLMARSIHLVGVDSAAASRSSLQVLGNRLSERGVYFLHGLHLSDIAPGDYHMIALPLSAPVNGRPPFKVVLRAVME
jgi:hypothetical protein